MASRMLLIPGSVSCGITESCSIAMFSGPHAQWKQRKRAPEGTRFEDDLSNISQGGMIIFAATVR